MQLYYFSILLFLHLCLRDTLAVRSDFNVSGLINTTTKEWINKPLEEGWSYRAAIAAGKKTPIEIDDYAFELGFTEKHNSFWFEGEGEQDNARARATATR